MPYPTKSEDDITEPELEALKKFKGVILARGYHCPQRSSDDFLVRFLRARQLDVKKAATMYGDYVQWRRENNVDSVLQVRTLAVLRLLTIALQRVSPS